MAKIKLTEIDVERWRFILYETPDKKWIASFSYSPQSYIDWSMLIELNDDEKKKVQTNRQYLIDMADDIRYSHEKYLKRALNDDDYFIKD